MKMKNVLDDSYDFITDFFYSGESSHYLKTGVYQRILDKAKNDEERENVKMMYKHLVRK